MRCQTHARPAFSLFPKLVSLLLAFHVTIALSEGSAPVDRVQTREAPGIQYSWAGSSAGDWNNASNWNPQGIPGPSDDVEIYSDFLSGVSVSLSQNTAVNSVIVGSGSILTITRANLTVLSKFEIVSSGRTQLLYSGLFCDYVYVALEAVLNVTVGDALPSIRSLASAPKICRETVSSMDGADLVSVKHQMSVCDAIDSVLDSRPDPTDNTTDKRAQIYIYGMLNVSAIYADWNYREWFLEDAIVYVYNTFLVYGLDQTYLGTMLRKNTTIHVASNGTLNLFSGPNHFPCYNLDGIPSDWGMVIVEGIVYLGGGCQNDWLNYHFNSGTINLVSFWLFDQGNFTGTNATFWVESELAVCGPKFDIDTITFAGPGDVSFSRAGIDMGNRAQFSTGQIIATVGTWEMDSSDILEGFTLLLNSSNAFIHHSWTYGLPEPTYVQVAGTVINYANLTIMDYSLNLESAVMFNGGTIINYSNLTILSAGAVMINAGEAGGSIVNYGYVYAMLSPQQGLNATIGPGVVYEINNATFVQEGNFIFSGSVKAVTEAVFDIAHGATMSLSACSVSFDQPLTLRNDGAFVHSVDASLSLSSSLSLNGVTYVWEGGHISGQSLSSPSMLAISRDSMFTTNFPSPQTAYLSSLSVLNEGSMSFQDSFIIEKTVLHNLAGGAFGLFENPIRGDVSKLSVQASSQVINDKGAQSIFTLSSIDAKTGAVVLSSS